MRFGFHFLDFTLPGKPATLATTLDVLSEGRSFFGLGAAWYEREHRMAVLEPAS